MAKIIEEEILNSIISYLATRPYQEVYQVLPVLQTLPEASPDEPKT